MSPCFSLHERAGLYLLRLQSADGTNRLAQECIGALSALLQQLASKPKPVVIAGNDRFFSAGADLEEISALNGPAAYEFSRVGQELMCTVEQFPAPVYAAVSGFCMGGGLDLALACHQRIAAPSAVFGHRGAALGLITGWGGTQRLPRLIGRSRALQMFVAAEKIDAHQALRIGLVDAVVEDPVAEAIKRNSTR